MEIKSKFDAAASLPSGNKFSLRLGKDAGMVAKAKR
jgi:hypothetical protein